MLLVVQRAVGHVSVEAFHGLLRAAFRIGQVGTFVRHVLVPRASCGHLIQFRGFLVGVTNRFASESLVFTTVSLNRAFQLAFSNWVCLPPIVDVMGRCVVAVDDPAYGTVNEHEVQFVVDFLRCQVAGDY